MRIRWGLVLAALLAGVVTVLAPATAQACSCVDRPLVATVQDPGLRTVFTATVAGGPDHAGDADGTGYDTWELRVDRVYRGQVSATTTVSTHHQASACGISFLPDRLYLVAPYDGVTVGLCGATTDGLTPEVMAVLGAGYPPTADEPDPRSEHGWSGWGPAAVGGVAGVALLVGGLWAVRRRRAVK
jgi:hypothetical protein